MNKRLYHAIAWCCAVLCIDTLVVVKIAFNWDSLKRIC